MRRKKGGKVSIGYLGEEAVIVISRVGEQTTIGRFASVETTGETVLSAAQKGATDEAAAVEETAIEEAEAKEEEAASQAASQETASQEAASQEAASQEAAREEAEEGDAASEEAAIEEAAAEEDVTGVALVSSAEQMTQLQEQIARLDQQVAQLPGQSRKLERRQRDYGRESPPRLPRTMSIRTRRPTAMTPEVLMTQPEPPRPPCFQSQVDGFMGWGAGQSGGVRVAPSGLRELGVLVPRLADVTRVLRPAGMDCHGRAAWTRQGARPPGWNLSRSTITAGSGSRAWFPAAAIAGIVFALMPSLGQRLGSVIAGPRSPSAPCSWSSPTHWGLKGSKSLGRATIASAASFVRMAWIAQSVFAVGFATSVSAAVRNRYVQSSAWGRVSAKVTWTSG